MVRLDEKENNPKQVVVDGARLTEGPVGRELLRMTLSMMIGFIAGAAFNIVDTYFVGRLGTVPLAAMGYTFPVVMIVLSLSVGLGTGTGSILARAIGRNDHHRVQRLTVDALLLGLLLAAVLVIIGNLTMKPVFGLLGAKGEALDLTMAYMRIWYPGIMFVIIPMVGNHAIRSTGDMLKPSLVMTIGLGLNALLDPLFIFGWGPVPAMGIRGAAWATVLSRIFSMIASLYILGRWKKMLTLERPRLAEVWKSWKGILYVAGPTSATHGLMPIVMGVITRVVSGFGTASVAALSAGLRIERCAVIPLVALGVSMVPFVGQNWGARNFDRVLRAQWLSVAGGVAWGVIVVILLTTFAQPIAGIFTEDTEVKKALVLLLTIMPLAFGFRGMSHSASGAMNAINRPFDSAANVLIRMLALQLPLVLLGARLFGFVGVLWGMVVADISAGLIAVTWVMGLYRRRRKDLAKDGAIREMPENFRLNG